nr:NADH-quinone oxidoreductase subunit M [Motiliproteus sp. SC1-56]
MSWLITLLLGGGLLAAGLGRLHPQAARWVALAVLGLALLWLLPLLGRATGGPWQPGEGAWLLLEQHAWIPRFGIQLLLGLDGLSLLLLLLTLVLGLVAVAASWWEIEQQEGFYYANLLWSLAGVVGVFTALDLFLFFFFWEVMLIPMYFLIGIWGHEARHYAAIKFFIYTQASSLLMLVGILGLAFLHQQEQGSYSFSYFDLLGSGDRSPHGFWLMLGFFIAFVVKLPAFPLHTWLPDAHTQAPTAGSIILAGVLLKTGAYGLIRFLIPLFPDSLTSFGPIAMGLGVAGILYAAVVAFAQTDLKRLIAYTSISHMGFVLLGVYAWNSLALQGAVLQMLTHGLSSAALFMLAGALQQRLHTRELSRMGGLWRYAPRIGFIALFFAMASLGMPGLGNFVAEFLVLAGSFQVNLPMTLIAALGLITAAVYALIMIQKAFHGPAPSAPALVDFDRREVTAMAVMMLGLLWMGLYPQPLIDSLGPVLDQLQRTAAVSLETVHWSQR